MRRSIKKWTACAEAVAHLEQVEEEVDLPARLGERAGDLGGEGAGEVR